MAMASSMNAQLPAFCSRFHHHQNTHTNVFSVDWSQYQAIYINPPFSQCTAVIRHLTGAPPAHTYFLAPQHPHRTPNWLLWLQTHAPFRLQLPSHTHLFTTLPTKHQQGYKKPSFELYIYYLPAASFGAPQGEVQTIWAEDWTDIPAS